MQRLNPMANEGSEIDEVNNALDGVGDEEEEEEEEEYTFKFKTGMNPLEFIDNNGDSGIQPYQRFERLEQEALADKKRGKREGSKNKLDPKLTRMLGDATLHYSCGHYDKAKAVLLEVIRLDPNLPESYHTLGLVYSSLEDYERAMAFYLIAAHLNPKDSSLWKTIFTWSIEQGYIDQARHCLLKAIKADPKDVSLRGHLARLYAEHGHYQKAAVTYEQVHQLCCENIDALKAAAKGTEASHVNEAMDLAE